MNANSNLIGKNNPATTWVATIIMLVCILGYTFGIARYESILLLSGYVIFFGTYLYISFNNQLNSRHWFITGIFLRLILCLSLPVLSDDFFRFVWDGRLLNAGVNPFENLPEAYLNKEIPGISRELYQNLNSTEYFTIYPPLNQLVFWFSVWLFPNSITGSVAVMRIVILAADIGNYFLIRKLASAKNTNPNVALIYFLNPLVILEFTGNLHFESVMIFFILLSIYFINRQKIVPAAISISLSVIAKLLPIMYMPAILRFLSFKKALIYYLVAGSIVIISFIPLISIEFLEGLSSSLDLYFRKFEFNASIYFIARAIGYAITGYNEIARIGPILGLLTIISISVYVLKISKNKVDIVEALLFIHLFYLLFATTVHPWYITTLLALTTLTKYRFAVVWSGIVFLTYVGYHQTGFSLPDWVLYVEYIALTIAIGYEYFNRNNLPAIDLSTNISQSTENT